MSSPSSGPKNKPSSDWYLLHFVFLLGFLFDAHDGEDMFFETSAYFQRATRRYVEVFITTAVRTSNFKFTENCFISYFPFYVIMAKNN
jgi:hypothetical protein